MLEKARDERLRTLVKEKCSFEICEAREEELQKLQFTWLKEQLSWLGLSTTGEAWELSPMNPINPDHWIGIYFGLMNNIREELLQFLDSNVGALNDLEVKELKSLYHKFLVTHSPRDPAVKLKGSVKKIQEFFMEYGIPYCLHSKKCSRNGKQRNWWFIERVGDSSQEK